MPVLFKPNNALFTLKFFSTKKLRTNEQIRALTVRLIGDENEQLGVMPREKAQSLADEAGLDLVEVSPKIIPPVCKVMDYGKYLYKLNKADQKQKKGQLKTEVKGIRIGFNTGQHDLEIKMKKAKEFLLKKNLVKVSLILRGREAAYKDLAKGKMREFAEKLQNEAVVDSFPRVQGYQITMMLKPKS